MTKTVYKARVIDPQKNTQTRTARKNSYTFVRDNELSVYEEEDVKYFYERDDIVVVYPAEELSEGDYLKEELVEVAEAIGVEASGLNKEELVEAINDARAQRRDE